LALSLIGVIRDQRKGYAIAILVVSAVFTFFLLRSYGIFDHAIPGFRPNVVTHP
jgi:hypothetical protein